VPPPTEVTVVKPVPEITELAPFVPLEFAALFPAVPPAPTVILYVFNVDNVNVDV
jgi:hypothetical protein